MTPVVARVLRIATLGTIGTIILACIGEHVAAGIGLVAVLFVLWLVGFLEICSK